VRRRLVAVLAIAVFALTAAPAFAHEHKVLGTVKAAAADHLTIQTTAGKDATIKIDSKTKVTRANATVKPESLAAGTRVVVTTASDESPYVAMTVQAGPAPSK
jgi:hypothetical protein